MPPSRKAPKGEKSVYAWTCGKKRSITHEALIAKGGFGEVHKVSILNGLLLSIIR